MSTSTICDETQVQQELKQDFSKLARIPHLAETRGSTANPIEGNGPGQL